MFAVKILVVEQDLSLVAIISIYFTFKEFDKGGMCCQQNLEILKPGYQTMRRWGERRCGWLIVEEALGGLGG